MKILRWAFMAAAIALTATACNDGDDNTIVDDYTLNISGPSEGNFFVDGKSWVAVGDDFSDYTKNRWVKFTVEGDTLVGGVKAKKIRSELVETGEKSPDCRVGYERNGVVYIWVDGSFRPIFDFNISGGSKIFTRLPDGNVSKVGYIECQNKLTVLAEGNTFNIFNLSNGYTPEATGGVWAPRIFFWIESIGTRDYPPYSGYITSLTIDTSKARDKFWSYESVIYVYQDDKLLFSYYDLSEGKYPVE